MKDLKPNPIIAPWASGTENRITIDQTTRENGVLYKGPVVSNQLNGMAYDIYSSVMYNQFTGGMYNNSLTYNEGQFCTIYWQKNSSTQKKLLKCICINKDPNGITAMPPVAGAAVQVINGVEFYGGGELDRVNWNFYEEGPIQTFDVNVPFNATTTDEFVRYSLFEIPRNIVLSSAEYRIAPLTKVVEVDATCLIEKTNMDQVNTAYANFPLKIRITYTLDPQSISPEGNLYTLNSFVLTNPPIDINYGTITTSRQDARLYPMKPGRESPELAGWLYYGLPYGLAFTFEPAPNSANARLTVESRGLNNLRIAGTSNVQFNPSRITDSFSSESWTFVVRQFGGSRVVPEIGSTKSYTLPQNLLYPNYTRSGQFNVGDLYTAVSSGVIDISDSSMWFRLLTKVSISNTTVAQFVSMFKNIKYSCFPRIYTSGESGIVIGNTQGDAIRNIRGSFMLYAVAGLPSPNTNPGVFRASSLHGAQLEGPGGGSSWQFDVSKGTEDKLPTTDPAVGENRPKSVVWEYRLQCF